jgi:cyclic pyranopterin monophosphate synthase
LINGYNSGVKNILSHIDDAGKAKMVDVGEKPDTLRTAVAGGEFKVSLATLRLIQEGLIKKGDVLTVAKIAGISAAKKTADLIPLCHNIPLNYINLNFTLSETLPGVEILAEVRSSGKTGAEMEALTAVSISALTLYDMVKAVEKTATIQNIRLIKKTGGMSGDVNNE